MEFLDQFKSFLLREKDQPSKATVKNYLADVRKFIRWFEARFARTFVPRLVTKEVVEDYKTQLNSLSSQTNIAAARSLKRYLSSLRKFFQFLYSQGIVTHNPFDITLQTALPEKDVWHVKEFTNFLILSHASKPTIKNYLADIKQFITWFEQVTSVLEPSDASRHAIESIDGSLIEDYKTRLLYDAKFEARSVNRKLSSLRKYFGFLQSQGFLKQQLAFTQAVDSSTTQDAKINTQLPLETLKAVQAHNINTEDQKTTEYSSFPPFRLVQKLGKGSNFLFDLLILWPVVKLLVAGKYQLWKMTGRQIFAPVETMIKTASTADLTKSVSQVQPAFEALITNSRQASIGNVANLPKSLYAPVYLSIKDYPLHKKLVHHLRYSRPAWYKKYHSYAFVHYLHFAIFLAYTTILGLTIYQAFQDTHGLSAPVLASLPASPPRMLAFEGTLTDATNTPITAEQTLRFGLYDNPTASASSLLWQETQDVQPDNNGKFKTMLGKNQPIYQSLLTDNPTLFLGITIGNGAELQPRQQIATVNYSQEASKVQGLAPITDPNAGTTNVLLALDSGGNLIVGGSASPRFEATGGKFTLAGNILTLTTTEGTNGNVQIVPDGSGIVDIQKPIQNTSNYNNLAGIQGAVEFDDSVAILATSSAQSAFIINQNGLGDLISASGSGLAKFTVNYLGVGTFASDVNVNGNNLNTISTNFNLLTRNVTNLNIGGEATNISIASISGQTRINNQLIAQNGLVIPDGRTITLQGFTKGAIPFVDANNKLVRDDNLVWANDSKRLGLGTNTPLYRLDVTDSQAGSNSTGSTSVDVLGNVAQIYNTNTGSEADGLLVKLGNNAPTTTNNFVSFANGAGNLIGKITGSSGGTNVIYNTAGADYAEYYKKADPSETFEQGDPVCITNGNGVSKCAPGQPILGVVSKTAGFVGAGNHDNDPAYVLVGTVGQLPVKIASGSGTIASGDPLTIGPGGVVKATGQSIILGHALQDSTSAAGQMIEVALNIGWYNPEIAINQEGDVLTQAQTPQATGLFGGIIENIKLGMIEARTISSQSLSIATDNISIGGVQLRDYVTEIAQQTTHDLENQFFTQKLVSPIAEITEVKTNVISPLADNSDIALKFDQSQIAVINPKVSSISAVASIDNQGNASFSGTLRAHRIVADEIDGLNIQAATISANYITNVTNIYNVASQSAQQASSSGDQQFLASTNQSPTTNYAQLPDNFTDTQSFTAEFAKFNQGLIALGGSSFTDIGVSGTLRVGENMRISDTSIDTVGTELALQPLRQGNLSLMGGLVTIDTDGNANFSNDVTVHGKFAANMIVPVPDQDLLMQLPSGKSGKESKFEIQTGTGSAALTVNQYGDVVASGSGSFGNVATKGFTLIRGVQADTSLTETVAQGSGGTAVITANERERTIITPYIKQTSLIYVTPTSQTYGMTPYIARQTDHSFTIQIPYSVTKDIKLNWWIVN